MYIHIAYSINTLCIYSYFSDTTWFLNGQFQSFYLCECFCFQWACWNCLFGSRYIMWCYSEVTRHCFDLKCYRLRENHSQVQTGSTHLITGVTCAKHINDNSQQHCSCHRLAATKRPSVLVLLNHELGCNATRVTHPDLALLTFFVLAQIHHALKILWCCLWHK